MPCRAMCPCPRRPLRIRHATPFAPPATTRRRGLRCFRGPPCRVRYQQRARRRAGPLERAVARVCRAACARVARNVRVADMNIDVPVADDRRIEVVANGLSLWHGSQLAVDATLVSPLVSPLTRTGEPHPRADVEPGRSVTAAARRKRHGTYPELLRARRCRLVVIGLEMGGRFGTEAATFLRLLARHRVARWAALLAFAAQRTFASSLLELTLAGESNGDDAVPARQPRAAAAVRPLPPDPDPREDMLRKKACGKKKKPYHHEFFYVQAGGLAPCAGAGCASGCCWSRRSSLGARRPCPPAWAASGSKLLACMEQEANANLPSWPHRSTSRRLHCLAPSCNKLWGRTRMPHHRRTHQPAQHGPRHRTAPRLQGPKTPNAAPTRGCMRTRGVRFPAGRTPQRPSGAVAPVAPEEATPGFTPPPSPERPPRMPAADAEPLPWQDARPRAPCPASAIHGFTYVCCVRARATLTPHC